VKRLPAWLLAAAMLPAAAHDSWLTPGLAFTTGNRYPRGETGMPAASLGPAQCVDRQGVRHALRVQAETAQALLLRTQASGAFGCWAELQPFELTLTPALVAVYFRDIRPDASVHHAWEAQRERGVPWQERYAKFARIEQGTADGAALKRIRAPVGAALEIVVEGEAPLSAGADARFRVLAKGQPVEGLAVELVSERNPLGVWARTDAEGRVQWRLPLAGAWLVRATRLEQDGDHWRSRFATLAFDAD
jgi:hypothetical protein